MFKINNPLRIALFLSVSIVLVGLGLFSFLSDVLNDVSLILIFLFLSCLIIYYIIKQFFHEKIKIIYKNIYKFKGTSVDLDLDIDNVEKEAEEWADAKEEELIQMKQDENYRREFLGNVSHELKTPIFNIQGYVQTLLDGGLNDEAVNLKFLERANKSVERMINIVDDLEVISRLETEQSELDIQKFNILNLVKEVFDQLEQKAQQMGIKLEINNEAQTEFVMGDRDKIQQVFTNLISNSIKYGKREEKQEYVFLIWNLIC